jgi:hypothetical protein
MNNAFFGQQFMNISKAKTEMSLNTGELEALKTKTVGERIKPLALSGMDAATLKSLADALWKQIIQIETAKYDLDERSKRQEYDVSSALKSPRKLDFLTSQGSNRKETNLIFLRLN